MRKKKFTGGVSSFSETKLRLLASMLGDDGIKLTRGIPRRPVDREPQLSFAQQRLWFLHHVDPDSPVYNIPGGAHLSGPLNVPALERSLNELVRRHEILRTTYVSRDGGPVQFINPATPLALPVDDLSGLCLAEREVEVRQLIVEESSRPFDLARLPIMRTRLLRLGRQEHIILFTVHHIATDGWSLGVLTDELLMIYRAYIKGQPSPLPELPIQYSDYAVWHRERLQGEVLEEQLNYWRDRLAGDQSVLRLPHDRPRPAVQTFKAETINLSLSTSLSDALRELSRREGVTLFITLLAAFKLFLHRYTGQHDIIVGTPKANRDNVETERLIGLFLNMLVLRTDLSGDPTFCELLARVREVTLGAFHHQDVPFDMLVMTLRPERNLSHMPLFQVAFGLQHLPAPPEPVENANLFLTPLAGGSGSMPYDLNLNLLDTPQGLSGSLDYNSDTLDAGTAEQMVRHFQAILKCIAAEPNRHLSEVTVLTPAEEQKLLREWNCTESQFRQPNCLHKLFEEQAARTPECIALTLEDENLTYAELNRQANRLAHYLRARGVNNETSVGLLMPRSFEMVVALLGILKAGAAYVPLDPEYPEERQAFIIEDSGVTTLLTTERMWQRSELAGRTTQLEVIALDAEWPAISREAEMNPEGGATPDNLAYVIYTSGSTGKPKGVMVEHRAITNRISWMLNTFDFNPDDCLLQKTTISFDASIWEFFVPLASGARVVLARPGGHRERDYLLDLVEREQVTILQLVPSMLRVFLEGEQVRERCRSLRYMFCGGEALPSELARQVRQSMDAKLCNLYGPTEASIDATVFPLTWDVDHDEQTANGVVSIGGPIANVSMYVLGRDLRPVPVGVTGELFIGGTGLARGYLNRADLTAERFIPNPFSECGGERLYHTGDLGKWDREGRIYYLGRVDRQVKVRGFRIELGEVESALCTHPDVSNAAVVCREPEDGEGETAPQGLVGYIVFRPGAACEVGDLHTFMSERLPGYMVPSTFIALDALPLTNNGKLDHKALPRVETQAMDDVRVVAPRTPLEEVLAGIWAEVLGVERVSVESNFFELGGHSLLALQVGTRVRKLFSVELTVRRMFESPTVTEMARAVEAEMRGAEAPQVDLAPVTHGREIPLSFAQQRLWFLNELRPDSAAYNVPTAVRVRGHLDLDALEQSLTEVVKRHSSLRTRFEFANGRPVQIIEPAEKFTLPLVDLQHLPINEREAEARRLATAEASRPFNLARAELLRGSLLRINDQEHVLLLTMHHIASDGWSSVILLRELSVLYDALAHGRPSPLPDSPIQYADYAVWQRDWLQGEVLEKQISYWREQLRGAPVLSLPTDKPRPEIMSSQGGHESLAMSRELAAALRLVGRREGATMFMVLLAAFQVVLSYLTGQEDVVVGTDVANRTRAETEGLIGFFVNQLVLRTDLSGNPTFRELLVRVREMALGAYAHQDLPFDKVVEELNPERTLSLMPLFQVKLVFQNVPTSEPATQDVELEPFGFDGTVAKTDLTLELVEGLELVAGVNYSTDIFNPPTIRRLLRLFETVLTHIATTPEAHLSELFAVLVKQDESQRVLTDQKVEQSKIQLLKSVRRKSITGARV